MKDDVPTADEQNLVEMPETPDAPVVMSGGWCAPSACGVGVCADGGEHDPGCPEPGWGYKLQLQGGMFILPAVSIKRGGIWFPRFAVYTTITKTGWREFYVKVQSGIQSHSALVGPFTRRKHARNAKDVIDGATRTLQGLYEGRA